MQALFSSLLRYARACVTLVCTALVGAITHAALVKVDPTPTKPNPDTGPNRQGYNFLMYAPANPQANAKYPLLLFYHGCGEAGGALSNAAKWGPIEWLEKAGTNAVKTFFADPANQAYVVHPHYQNTTGCGTYWAWNATDVEDMRKFLVNNYAIDPNRIYITSFSRGGTALWPAVGANGDKYGAAAPIDSQEGSRYALRNAVGMPLWMMQNNDDSIGYKDTRYYGDEIASMIGGVHQTNMYLAPNTPIQNAFATDAYTASFSQANGWQWVKGTSTAPAKPTSQLAFSSFKSGGHSTSNAMNFIGLFEWLFAQSLTNRTPITPHPFLDTTQPFQVLANYPSANDVALTGTWTDYSNSSFAFDDGAWGSVHKRATPTPTNSPTATYKFSIPAAGRYRLYGRWPLARAPETRNASVPIRVPDNGSTITFNVDQTNAALGEITPLNGGRLYGNWQTVGEVTLAAGLNQIVIDTTGLANQVAIDALRFVPLSTPVALPFDIDGNGACETSIDALLVIRYLFGFRDDRLIANITFNPQAPRTAATSIANYLASILPTLDIDEDGARNAATDGLMFYRYTKLLAGASLTNAARNARLNGTTKSDADIKAYFDSKCLPQ